MSEMQLKYSDWIFKNITEKNIDVTAKCCLYVPAMRIYFPELELKKGVVYSESNPDNYETHPREYPHMWLEDEFGDIVDPTVQQFKNLGNIVYKEAPSDADAMSKCMNCAKYFYSVGYFCSDACQIDYSEYQARGFQ